MQGSDASLLAVVVPKAPATCPPEDAIAFDLLTRSLTDKVLDRLKTEGGKKPFGLIVVHESDLLALNAGLDGGVHVAAVERAGGLQCSVVSASRLVNSDDDYSSGLGTVRLAADGNLANVKDQVQNIRDMLGQQVNLSAFRVQAEQAIEPGVIYHSPESWQQNLRSTFVKHLSMLS